MALTRDPALTSQIIGLAMRVYTQLGQCKVELLLSFNVVSLKNGIQCRAV
jgi:hypothetical protein